MLKSIFFAASSVPALLLSALLFPPAFFALYYLVNGTWAIPALVATFLTLLPLLVFTIRHWRYAPDAPKSRVVTFLLYSARIFFYAFFVCIAAIVILAPLAALTDLDYSIVKILSTVQGGLILFVAELYIVAALISSGQLETRRA